MGDKTEDSDDLKSILVGKDAATIRVPMSVLDNSPVLSEWVRDLACAPASVKKGDVIYLKGCEPDIVHPVLHFLGKKDEFGFTSKWGSCPLTGKENPAYFLRMYKFATSIKADAARNVAFEKLRERSFNVEKFMEAMILAGELGIVEDPRIAGWIGTWLSEHLETVMESEQARKWVLSDDPKVWVFTKAILGSLVGTQTRLDTVQSRLIKSEARLHTYTDRSGRITGVLNQRIRSYERKLEKEG